MRAIRVLVFGLVLLGVVPAAPAAVIELAVGESAVVSGLQLTFDQLIQDGRCPIPLACFWEGDGVIQISAQAAGSSGQFELHTFRDFGSEVGFLQWEIELLELDPYPVDGVIVDPEDYVGTFDVRMQTVADRPSSWSVLKGLFQ